MPGQASMRLPVLCDQALPRYMVDIKQFLQENYELISGRTLFWILVRGNTCAAPYQYQLSLTSVGTLL